MSMISEQTKRLRQYARFSRTTNPSWSAEMLRAADTIEELAEKIHAANMERSLKHCNDDWIPFDELPPKESGKYCISIRNGEVEQSYYDKERDMWSWYAKRDVEAWQELPEPYQKSED